MSGRSPPTVFHPLASLMVFADVGDLLSLEPAERTRFRAEAGRSPAPWRRRTRPQTWPGGRTQKLLQQTGALASALRPAPRQAAAGGRRSRGRFQRRGRGATAGARCPGAPRRRRPAGLDRGRIGIGRSRLPVRAAGAGPGTRRAAVPCAKPAASARRAGQSGGSPVPRGPCIAPMTPGSSRPALLPATCLRIFRGRSPTWRGLSRPLHACRNDLEAPAIGVAPPDRRGAGAPSRPARDTARPASPAPARPCFALCESAHEAEALAFALARDRPSW